VRLLFQFIIALQVQQIIGAQFKNELKRYIQNTEILLATEIHDRISTFFWLVKICVSFSNSFRSIVIAKI